MRKELKRKRKGMQEELKRQEQERKAFHDGMATVLGQIDRDEEIRMLRMLDREVTQRIDASSRRGDSSRRGLDV
ncbi:hypothetical protein GOP47_0019369 [Adiantum capillus-veneris]|uniref:Uncharacterized protein n=1 Tax=Adiantum capillus-veneris TaxID=13818 RepID=A0A9D4Z7S4_ADICA|nr:hypothetical protein GOP47_0019369 [Adiantum capillus-veneris]